MSKSPPSQRKTDKYSECRWFSPKPGKRWCEVFSLWYSVVWISAFGVIVATQVYEHFDEWGYMYVGLGMATPFLVAPFLFPGQGEPGTPLLQRFWVKANIWIAILSFIGNYLWTHYFYNLLGASYTFRAHRINDVPIALIFCTHAYFMFYHTLTTVSLRRFWTSPTYEALPVALQKLSSVLLVFVMSYTTAYMETLTIESFPYYTFKDRDIMYSVGSVCYSLYFIVSFPMYYRIEEAPGDVWTLDRVAVDSLGACMLVTLLLDAWRLLIGSITDSPAPTCVPFM